jgi:hypothetical protein
MSHGICRFCRGEGYFTSGHHGCQRGIGKPLGLHNHRYGQERHWWCSYCGAQWRT